MMRRSGKKECNHNVQVVLIKTLEDQLGLSNCPNPSIKAPTVTVPFPK